LTIGTAMSDFTRILDRAQGGDPKAANELLPLVYEELRKLAVHRMACGAPGQTLQPLRSSTRLGSVWSAPPSRKWNSRGHFFAAAAEARMITCTVPKHE
jgi:hypothetical protein